MKSIIQKLCGVLSITTTLYVAKIQRFPLLKSHSSLLMVSTYCNHLTNKETETKLQKKTEVRISNRLMTEVGLEHLELEHLWSFSPYRGFSEYYLYTKCEINL